MAENVDRRTHVAIQAYNEHVIRLGAPQRFGPMAHPLAAIKAKLREKDLLIAAVSLRTREPTLPTCRRATGARQDRPRHSTDESVVRSTSVLLSVRERRPPTSPAGLASYLLSCRYTHGFLDWTHIAIG